MIAAQRVQEHIDCLLERVDPRIRRAADRLAARIGIGPSPVINSWSDHYSTLVALYPELQCTGMVDEGRLPGDVLSKRAGAAHLGFLIQAFVEDRILDDQIVLDSDETAFVEAVSRQVNAVLVELHEGIEPERDWRHRLISGYDYGQNHGYEVNVPVHPPRVHPSRIRKVACGRGYLGALIPLGLAAKCGASAEMLRRMKNAFDCLMLGLQWLDDLADWPEDVENGDINLMLSVMRERGPDPYSHPPNHMRMPNIAHALLKGGYLDFAGEQTQRWLAHARDRQDSLGCHELAGLIEERRVAVRAMAAKAGDDAESRVLSRFIALQAEL